MSDETNVSTDVSSVIAGAVQGPKRVSGDAGSAEQFDLKDLIAADQYLSNKQAAAGRNRGLRFNKLVPDGTAGRGHLRPYYRHEP
jgi:hypothetical protein